MDPFQYSFYNIQAEPVDAREAVDCRLASKVVDNISANGIAFTEKIKARDVNTLEHLGDNDSVTNPWKEQRKKSVHKPKQTVQLNLFNRFSFWEDENDDESELICLPKVMHTEVGLENKNLAESEYITIRRNKKTKVKKRIAKQEKTMKEVMKEKETKKPVTKSVPHKCKKKKRSQDFDVEKRAHIIETSSSMLKYFKTENSFSVFQNKTQAEIESFLEGKCDRKMPSKKKKCNNCGFKKYCKLKPLNCKADGKRCRVCKKENHFPNSQNCKKSKSMKKIKGKVLIGCQTLRTFLMSKHYHLVSGLIPFEILLNEKHSSQENEVKTKHDVSKFLSEIRYRIARLEGQLTVCENYNNMTIKDKFFLHLYALTSLEYLLFENFQNPKTSTFYEVKPPEEEFTINKFFEDYVKIDDFKETRPEKTNNLESRMNKNKALIEVYSKKLNLCFEQHKNIPQVDGIFELSSSSSSECEETEILNQVDGASELMVQEQVPSILTSFHCQSEMLCAAINVLRSFDEIWLNSLDHPLCLKAKCKEGLRCLFCSFRSFSLRINRAKTKRFLKPVEILSQMDQLPREENFQTRFSEFFQTILTAISSDEAEFSRTIFGNDKKCLNCASDISNLNSCIINLSLCDAGSQKEQNLERTLGVWMEKVKLEHKRTARCEMIKLEQKKINQLVMLAFDPSQKIKMTPSINVFGVHFELLCCVEELKQNTMRTFFKNQDQFYFADANQIPTISKIKKTGNLCLAIEHS